ncbi:MAG: shikimate dehydrogenase, partial [Firmicutes bacterium]|nr:shikimate dehydrogenase [Bacillota bacterium]
MDKQFGLLGFPLEHSISDVLHKNLFGIKKNKDSAYSFYETAPEEFTEKLDIYRNTLNGFNVTIPYKIKIADYLDSIDEQAKIIGAVNTVKTASGFLSGYNTDIDGLEYCFKKDKVELNKKTALVIGCGGFSKTAVYFLHLNKAQITVCGRDIQKLIGFQKECDSNKIRTEIKSLKNLNGEFDIIINCTPVG